MTARRRKSLVLASTRSRQITAAEAGAAVLAGANVIAGVFDVMSGLENGDSVAASLKRAVKRGKKRAKKLAEAAEDPDDER